MEDVLNVAAYISQRYYSEYNQQIDEMKLHKLMYLIQREAIIQTGEPLFNATFYGWKYGPVLRSVYDTFKKYGANAIKGFAAATDGNVYVVNQSKSSDFKYAFEKIWRKYSDFDGIVLSSFTHQSNTAWRKAIDRRSVYLLDMDIASEEDYVTD